MSYDKNTWQTGDVITAEKLNHMEDGIADGGGGGGVLVVGVIVDGSTMTFDKTWQQIHDADYCIVEIIAETDTAFYLVVDIGVTPLSKYRVTTVDLQDQPFAIVPFECDTPNDYPVYSEG